MMTTSAGSARAAGCRAQCCGRAIGTPPGSSLVEKGLAANVRRFVLRIRNRCHHASHETRSHAAWSMKPHTRSIYARVHGKREMLVASVCADERPCPCLNTSPDCATCDFGESLFQRQLRRLLSDCSRTSTRKDCCNRRTRYHRITTVCLVDWSSKEARRR